MTLAGTRPPTVDEWDKYELHHRARLATKPGLTGMWQVSGRSNITDLIKPRVIDNFDELQKELEETEKDIEQFEEESHNLRIQLSKENTAISVLNNNLEIIDADMCMRLMHLKNYLNVKLVTQYRIFNNRRWSVSEKFI